MTGPPDGNETLTGGELRELAFDGETSGIWVHRDGGLAGSALADDISTDRWTAHPYRVARTSERPGPDWFEVEQLLEAIADHRWERREAAGWRVEGVVIVDSAAVAVARVGADRRLDPAEPLPFGSEMYVYQTMADLDLPVETRTVDNEVVEVRVDVVDDVDEIESDGEWVHLGDLAVGEAGVAFFDPYKSSEGDRIIVRLRPGTWSVSILDHGTDELSLRLTPARDVDESRQGGN